MKNLIGLICLAICSLQAQSFEKASLESCPVDSLATSLTILHNSAHGDYHNAMMSLRVDQKHSDMYVYDTTYTLSDTLKGKLLHIDDDKITFEDAIDENGHHRITYNKPLYESYFYKDYYIFPSTRYSQIDPTTIFEIDWHKIQPREPSPHGRPTEDVYCRFYSRADTIFTMTEMAETGGVTPEGLSFGFAGAKVDSISVQTKAIYSIGQTLYSSTRDAWGEHLYNLETPWIDCTTGPRSYKMPMLKQVNIDKDTFAKIKSKAIEVQRELLINKRDSLAKTGYGQYIEDILKKLKPNFEDGHTANELSLSVDLRYFINKIKVYYSDGTTKDFFHIADFSVSHP